MKKRIALILITVALALSVGLLAVGCQDKPTAAEYTVTFDYNYDGAPAPVAVKVKEGEKATAPEVPARSGYKFNGWHLYGSDYDFGAVTEDITVEAYWRDASIVDVIPETKYAVNFAEVEGVTYDYGGAKPAEAVKDEVVSFAVKVSPYHVVKDFAVKANGTELEADADGAYHVTVTSRTDITVEGVERDPSRITGNGTEANPYVISSPIQWIEFVHKCNDYLGYNGSYYKLGADLDFGGETIPMVEAFQGELDGNGKTIRNYNIELNETIVGEPQVISMAGLFQYVALARISDLTLEDFSVFVSSNSVVRIGGIAGAAISSDIMGCRVSGDIFFNNTYAYYFYAGGIAGYLTTGRSGNSSDIAFCTAEVDIHGDATGFSGGIAGEMVGLDEISPAFIANCSASGTISSGRAGGLVGNVGPYSAITDSYFSGSIVSDTEEYQRLESIAGGLIGVIDPAEVAVVNCFASANVSVNAYEGTATFSGPVYGTVEEYSRTDGPAVPAYGATSLIKNTYGARKGTFSLYDTASNSVGSPVEVRSHSELVALLGWRAASWVSDGGSYPSVVRDAFTLDEFETIVSFDGETIEYDDAKVANKYTAEKVTMYTPLGWLMGTDAAMTFVGEENSKHVSVGLYSDSALSERLPSAYLVTENDGTVYMGFGHYEEVIGGEPYYLTVGETTYEITLGAGNTCYRATFSSGARTYSVPFVYYGGGEMLFATALPADISATGSARAQTGENELALECVNANGTYSYKSAYRASGLEGTWYGDDATYTFRAGVGVKVTAETSANFGYSIEGSEVTLEFAAGAKEVYTVRSNSLDSSAGDLTREDKFRGDYEAGVYSSDSVSFDGRGTGYTLSADGTEATKDGKTYSFDDSGFLVCKESGVTFGLEGGAAGMWTSTKLGYTIVLTGITRDGFGAAMDSVGNVFTYYANSEGLVFVSGSRECGTAKRKTDNGVEIFELNIPEIGVTVKTPLRLDDPFRGTWYPEDLSASPKFAFEFGKVSVVGGAGAAEYTYSDGGDTVNFTIGEVAYSATYDYDTGVLTVNGAAYVDSDGFGEVVLMAPNGLAELSFNGLGEIGLGKMSLAMAGSATVLVYDYSVNGGVATVKDATGNTWLTISFDSATGLYDVLEDGAETVKYGVSNIYTGEWSVRGDLTMKLFIGALNSDYEGEARVGDNVYGVAMNENGMLEIRDPDDGSVAFLVHYDSTQGMLLYTSDGPFSMAITDTMSGTWTTADGSGAIAFDGAGFNNAYYLGACRYRTRVGYYMDCYYSIDDAGLFNIYANVSGSSYPYFLFNIVSADDEDKAHEIYDEFNPTVFYNADKSRCIFVMSRMADGYTGTECAFGGLEYEFLGNTLEHDATLGAIGFNYVHINGTFGGKSLDTVCAYQSFTSLGNNTYEVELYEISSFRRENYLPSYVATVTVNANGEITAVNLENFELDMLFADLYA